MIINEKVSNDLKGYKVEFMYDGDTLSPYTGTVIVISDNEQDAIKQAKSLVKDHYDNPVYFKVIDDIESLVAYRDQYPNSGFPIIYKSRFYDSKDLKSLYRMLGV